MVLDRLSQGLKDGLKKIAETVFVGDRQYNELIRDLQRTLLQADVDVQLVMQLTERIKQRLKETGTNAGQREFVVKTVYDELARLFGAGKLGLQIGKKKPYLLMLVGLYGSGKTTTAAKLGKYYATRGHRVALIGLDVHRAAAPLQLQKNAEDVHIDCFVDSKEKNPVKIWKRYESKIKEYDLVIVDTAGRDALSEELLEEIKDVMNAVNPDERILVISAEIGQAAKQQAQAFHDKCKVTGVIVTKLDGSAKGGGALTACATTGAAVYFLGVGEKAEDFESFDAESFVGRMLGMGDLHALLEKAETAIKAEDAKELGEKMLSGEFTLVDLYTQLQAVKKMGKFSKLLEMVPGFGKMKLPAEMLEVQESKLEKWKVIIDSMTKKEIENPEIVDAGRASRIAKGAHVKPGDVRELIKHYMMSKKLMKNMGGKKMQRMMQQFGIGNVSG